MKITFSTNIENSNADARDIMNFAKMIIAEPKLQDIHDEVLNSCPVVESRIYAHTYEVKPHATSELMEIATIAFQQVVGGQHKNFVWTASRAKDFCCLNMGFTEIK